MTHLQRMFGFSALALLLTISPAFAQAEKPGDPPKADAKAAEPAKAKDEPTYVNANLKLRDVNLPELLKKANVDVPIKLEGKVSLDVKAEIPISGDTSIKNYRIDGSLTSEKFIFENMTLLNFKALVVFRDGLLTLTELSGTIDAPDKPGTFNGTASFGVEPRTELNATLTLDSIPLDEIVKAAPSLKGLATGRLSGKATVQAPADKLDDPASFIANATITSEELTGLGRKAKNLTVTIDVKDGIATLTKAAANVEGLPIQGNGTLKLTDKYAFDATILTEPSDTAAIEKIVPEAGLPFALTGKFDTTTKVTGTLQPLTYELGGKFNATNLNVGKALVNKISTDWALNQNQISLKNIDAVVKDGTIKGDATVPLADKGDGLNANLTINNLDLDELAKASPDYAGLAGGILSGKINVQAPADKLTTPGAYTGSANVTSPKITAYKRHAKNVEIIIDVKDGVATLSKAVGNVEGLPLTVAGAMKLSDSFAFTANIVTQPSDTATITKIIPEVELPFDLSGKFDTNTKVTGTLEPLTYDLSGKFNADNLSVGEALINHIRTDYALTESQITLKNIDALIKDGTLKGDAAVPLNDKGKDLNVNLTLDKLPLDELAKASPDYADLVGGIVSGKINVQAPAGKFTTPATYTGSANITAPQLTAYKRHANNVDLTIDIKDGMATLSKAVANLEGLPLAMAGTMKLSDTFPFAVNIVTEPTDTAAIQKIVPEAGIPFELTGKFDTKTKITGTLEPLTYDLNGKLNATNLTVGTATIDSISTDYALTETQLTLKDLDASVYKGTIKGNASVPLGEVGEGQFDIVFKDVNSATITKTVPSLPIKLSGDISGSLKGTIPKADAKGERPIKADLQLSAPKLNVQGIPADKLEGAIKYQPEHILYQLKGQTLGGTFDLDGDFPLDKFNKPEEKKADENEPISRVIIDLNDDDEKHDGTLRIDNIDFSLLSRVLRIDAIKPLKGRVRALIKYDHDPVTGIPVGNGVLQIQGPGWGEFGSGTRVSSNIRFSSDSIVLEDLHGYFSEGSVRASAIYDLKDPDRSNYTFRISGLNTMKILKPLGYDTLGGQVTMTGRGRLGRLKGGNGTISFHRARVAGLNMADMTMSYSWTYSDQGSAQVALRDISGRIFGGRVRGNFDLSYSRTATLKGDLRFVDVSFRSLLGKGGASGYGGNRMNGMATIAGRNVRSINDITGLVTAEIGPGPVFDLPIFTQLARVALPTLSGKSITEFDKGAVIARLAKGVVKVERFSLEGLASSIFVSGTVGLNGRLDLDAIVATGNLALNSSFLSRIGVRIPAIGPIPVATIIKVAQFLSDRTIRANIVGTIDSPQVRINYAALITEEAIRFFTNTLSPVPIPTSSGIPK